MRALVTNAPRSMEMREVPEPAGPGPAEVELKIEAVGICGSDYGLYLGKHPLSNFPLIQGHEFSARVMRLGPQCEGSLPEGTLVAVEPLLSCGACYPCRVGRYNCCTSLNIIGVHRQGAMQERLIVPERLLHGVEGLSPAVAAFAEPLTISLQAAARGGVAEGEKVLGMGAGPIGQAAILACRSRGACVAVTDLVEERLERAKSTGAEQAFGPGDDLATKITEWTSGDGPAVIIDATGVPGVIRSAVDLVAAAGRVVLVGISTNDVPLPTATLVRKEISILASRNSARTFPQAIRVLRQFTQEVEKLITQEIELAAVQETIELAIRSPATVEKAVITFKD